MRVRTSRIDKGEECYMQGTVVVNHMNPVGFIYRNGTDV